jgi:predicted aspartyl protease
MRPLLPGFGLPAAIVGVSVQNPNAPERQRNLDGIIDTGADLSLIPATLAEQIGVRSHTRMFVSGVDGLNLEHPVFIVNLEFAETKLERRAVCTWNGTFAILGRDVLDEFIFVYDGKTGQFEIRDP